MGIQMAMSMKLRWLKIKRESIALLSKIRLKQFRTDYLKLKLRVPIVYGLINGGYIVPAETWMGDCLASFIKTKKGCVIDIGVNVGLYLVKLRVISKQTPYYGFEPNPACSLYTQELIRLNKFTPASVFQIALSDSENTARFYASAIGDKQGSLIKSFKAGENLDYSFDVLTTTGDKIIANLKPDAVSVIKIDVEEAELYVTRGLEQSIKKYRPYLYCEIHDSDGDDTKLQNTKELCDLVARNSYNILGITKDRGKMELVTDTRKVGVDYLQEYIFCPKEMVADFIDSIKNNSSGITPI